MIQTKKLRINLIAKDFDIKSKELTEILAANGIKNKGTSALLTEEEYSVLIDKLTLSHQIKNMGDYLSGKADIKREKPVEAENTANAEPEEKAKPVSEPVLKVEETKAPETVKAPEDKKITEPVRASETVKAPENTRPQEQQKKPFQNTSSQARPQQQAQKPQQGKPTEKRDFGQKQPERGASKQTDRFVRPQQNQAQVKKPLQKPQRPQQPTQPQNTPFMRPTGTGEKVIAERKTRVIDTRARTVDLSKYDEKLDRYNQDARANAPTERQKFKKQPSKPTFLGGNRRQDRDKYSAAASKSRRAELEKLKKQPLQIAVPDEITVAELAQRMKVTVGSLIKKLIELGTMATANQTIDYDTAFLAASEMNIIVTKEVVVTIEEKLFDDSSIDSDKSIERSPVVCVMGHVDHGKTSLLDAIRNTHVTAGEAGGITQSIGAYRVKIGDKYITFLDTPGHEAFTAMRARGAKATDIAILVVAADDGVKPQTIEAINHAKAANISIIVAINKMDKPGARPEEIKQELTKFDLVPEEWGGDVMCVPVSALKKTGIKELLEDVLLLAEMKELKADPERRAKGIVIEASLKKGLGPVATVLIQNGTLRPGDAVIAGKSVGRVRIMRDENGKDVKLAGPSVPVEIVGLDSVPAAGDELNAIEDERMARELAQQRRDKEKSEEQKSMKSSGPSLDELFEQIKEGVKDLNIIVKADVGGSAEAVKSSLLKLSNNEVHVNVIHSAVGGITEGDVTFASASKAIIIGFNVRPDKAALDSASRQGVEIRTYRIIYECIDEVQAAINGMLKPVYREVVLGHAQVRQTIHVPNVGTIAGSYVQDGKITRASQIRIVRDGTVIFEDKISSLKRFKDDAKEVASGYECGVGLEKFNDIKENDILEAFIMEQIKR